MLSRIEILNFFVSDHLNLKIPFLLCTLRLIKQEFGSPGTSYYVHWKHFFNSMLTGPTCKPINMKTLCRTCSQATVKAIQVSNIPLIGVSNHVLKLILYGV